MVHMSAFCLLKVEGIELEMPLASFSTSIRYKFVGPTDPSKALCLLVWAFHEVIVPRYALTTELPASGPTDSDSTLYSNASIWAQITHPATES